MIARRIPLIVALALLVACGASARQKTIRITYETISLAATELPQFTITRGKQIVDEAKAKGETKEQAGAEVEAFLAKANHADLAVKAAINMTVAAAVLDDDRSLAALLKVAAMLRDELKELGVTK